MPTDDNTNGNGSHGSFNLLAALRGSLRVIENPAPGVDPDSPLSEATADSVNFLLSEINDALAEGMPEKITDEKLALAVDIFRAQALRWVTEEADKANKPRTTRRKKNEPDLSLAVDIEL